MYIIKNLPIFLPLVVCVVLSILGLRNDIGYAELSYKIIIAVMVFYVLGVCLRGILIRFLVKALEISEKKARLIREARASEDLAHSFSSASGRSHVNTYRNDEEDLDPYEPERFQ